MCECVNVYANVCSAFRFVSFRCACTCKHVCVHARMHVHKHVCMCACAHVPAHMQKLVCMCACAMCVCLGMQMSFAVSLHFSFVFMCARCVCTYVHTCMRMCMNMCMWACLVGMWACGCACVHACVHVHVFCVFGANSANSPCCVTRRTRRLRSCPAAIQPRSPPTLQFGQGVHRDAAREVSWAPLQAPWACTIAHLPNLVPIISNRFGFREISTVYRRKARITVTACYDQRLILYV